MTDDAQTELTTAIEVARTALAEWREDPTAPKFRIWRDASEVAIKWHRACRLGTGADDSFDEGLKQLLAAR